MCAIRWRSVGKSRRRARRRSGTIGCRLPVPASPLSLLVAIPCLNEEATVASVVADFRRALPEASVVVYDNGSTDRTAERARAAGAEVVPVPDRGKGRVVRAILSAAGADVVVLVDGDGTYSAEAAPALVGPVLSGEADMVVGRRVQPMARSNLYRRAGNRVIVIAFNLLTGTRLHDVLSGYRAVGPRVLERIELTGDGFEVEAELTARATAAGLRTIEVPAEYGARPAGSRSKLRPVRDGARILRTALRLARWRSALRYPEPAAAPAGERVAPHRAGAGHHS